MNDITLVSMGKKYRTKDGYPVHLLCGYGFITDGQPIVGIVEGVLQTWNIDGHYLGDGADHYFDLVEDKPKTKIERWINVYKGGGVGLFEYRDFAIRDALGKDDFIIVVAQHHVWEDS